MENDQGDYGRGRIHKNVSYEDVERAAIAILKSARRPTVETVRAALGGGSPHTLAVALRRFWRDLGARIEGDPAALSRMPAEIAEIADGMWQRALTLASTAAKSDDNAARERLSQLQLEVEIRHRSFDLRDQEIDRQVRERERVLADRQEHLIALSRTLSREQANNEALQSRVADMDGQLERARSQIAALIAASIARSRKSPRAAKPESQAVVVGSRHKAAAKHGRSKPLKRAKSPSKKKQLSKRGSKMSRHAKASREKR